MSLTTFFTGLSGLSANSQGLNVIGNNLANLNTIGFKASQISFTDVLGQMFGTPGTPKSGNIGQIGLGAQVGSVRAAFTQGTLQTTNNPLDLAIQGKGFLVVKNAAGGQLYSRAGNLHLDSEGNLVTDGGATVQGYVRNASTGKIDAGLGLQSIKLPSGLDLPSITSEMELGMNLDGNAADGAKFSTSISVYDSLGKPHIATLSLQKEVTTGATPVTKWRFDITIPNNEVAGVASTNAQKLSLITGAIATNPPAAGALLFDSAGKMTSAWLGTDPATPPPLANLTFPPSGVTLPQMANGATLSSGVLWKLIGSNGTPNITGLAAASEVTASSQNGASAGSLSNLAVQADGTIAALFSNGKTADVGQIVLAQFANAEGLQAQGGGLYAESPASGSSLIGVPGAGGSAQLISGAVEQSNVDLAAELTKIITFQRAYQANARMISLTDQIMQETMNMRQ